MEVGVIVEAPADMKASRCRCSSHASPIHNTPRFSSLVVVKYVAEELMGYKKQTDMKTAFEIGLKESVLNTQSIFF